MKNIVKCIVLCLAFCCFTTGAQADQFKTTFDFSVCIKDNCTPLTAPSPPGRYLILPSAFSDWHCYITNKFLSNDGTELYHNFVCENVNNNIIVGSSVDCQRSKPDFTYKSFFLRNGGVNATFIGSCVTSSTNQQSPQQSPGSTRSLDKNI